MPILVEKVGNESIESMLRKFKRKIKKSGLMMELKQKAFFEKPSMKKKRKRSLAIIRAKEEFENNKSN